MLVCYRRLGRSRLGAGFEASQRSLHHWFLAKIALRFVARITKLWWRSSLLFSDQRLIQREYLGVDKATGLLGDRREPFDFVASGGGYIPERTVPFRRVSNG